jgi:ribosomal protein S14
MIIDAFAVFMVLAWLREHGRAIRLENLCRKCIEDMRVWESKEKARVEPVAPVKVQASPRCTMCGHCMSMGSKCFSMSRKTAPNTKMAIVCNACNSKFHAMMK